MRARRVPLAVVVVATAGLVTPALAHPGHPPAKPAKQVVCDLVTDPRGDDYVVKSTDLVMPEPALDIVSADVATNTVMLTAVVRVAKLAPVPTGAVYALRFSVTGAPNPFYASASLLPNGTATFSAGWQHEAGSTQVSGAYGVVDGPKNEVRISVPLSALRGQGAVTHGRSELAGLVAQTYRGLYIATYADDAASKRAYRAGTPSCVRVGA